jgi:hypothetical protein
MPRWAATYQIFQPDQEDSGGLAGDMVQQNWLILVLSYDQGALISSTQPAAGAVPVRTLREAR